MATATYTLGNFIADLDRITRDETSPHVITERVTPLLAKLVMNPGVVPVEFRRRPQGQPRGRYMLHRAPRFNVTAVVWGPRETARAHNHETWGVIGVIDNEIEETRYRVEEGATAGRATLAVKRGRHHTADASSRLAAGGDGHAAPPPADGATA